MAREPGSDEGQDRDDLGPCPEQSSGVDDETIATVFSLSLINAVHLRYKKAVLKHVVMPSPDAVGDTELLSHFDRLTELDALPYLSTIWKETRRFVSRKEMARAGVTTCINGNRPLTRNMLGVEAGRVERKTCRVRVVFSEGHSRQRLIDLIERSSEGQKYVRRASRLADAAEVFGLIEPDLDWKECEGPTSKPIRATTALDGLMREVAVYHLALIRSAAVAGAPHAPMPPSAPETDVE